MIDAWKRRACIQRGDPGTGERSWFHLRKKGKSYRDWIKEKLEENCSEVLNRLAEEDLAAYREA
jgi:predicted house-cleaning noncanonical NTP pyrophosphatase (MazG superfamily)